MQRLLLVAAREFRAIAATRSFWLVLLIMPLAVSVGPLTARLMDKSSADRVMIVDPAGREAGALARRIELENQRKVLVALSRYARRWKLETADPDAAWARSDVWYGDADVARFVAEGGQGRAVAVLKAHARPDTPPFHAPDPPYVVVPTPPAVAAAAPGGLDAALAPLLQPGAEAKRAGQAPLDYAVYVPRDFGAPRAVARVWANGQPGDAFLTLVRGVLTREVRLAALAAAGVDGAHGAALADLQAPILVSTPPPGGGAERMIVRSILPLAAAYLLLLSLLMSGSWMLQGLVEERSNKLLETVLACVSPNELMYGKLLGVTAVGLLMVGVWLGCGVGVAYASRGAFSDMIRPALAPFGHPAVAAAMIYYFLAGYIMFAMIFMAIGAMSDSMRDAQGYLTPVILLITLPVGVLAQAVLRDPGGVGPRIMTWIPIYTPFAMLARLGGGVATWEVVGAAVLLAAFVALELVLLGRLFRASLLRSGQRRTLVELGRLALRAGESS